MTSASMRRCLLIAAFVLASLPADLNAQVETLIGKNKMNRSNDGVNAKIEAVETKTGKCVVPETQPMLQPGTLRPAGQASVKPSNVLKTSSDTPRALRKSWMNLGSGTLPLAVAIQPDVAQRYGPDPAILQLYFGRRH
jgi:hypothetical protein